MKRSWLLTPTVLVVIAAISYAIFLFFTPPLIPAGLLYGNGRIEGTEIVVSSEVTGRVIESSLVEGRIVAQDEILVRIDDADLRIGLAQADAERNAIAQDRSAIEEQLRTAQHHVENARRDAERYRDLRARESAAVQRLEQSENILKEAQGRLAELEARKASADARIEAAQQRINLIRSQLQKTEIKAPIGGTVLVKAIEPGEFASPGRAIATIVDLSRLELKIYVPEKDIGRIKLNDPVRVRTDAFPDDNIDGVVARIDQQAQFTPRDIHMPEERVRTVFGVTVSLDNPTGELKPGMPADAWIKWRTDLEWPEELVVPQ